MVERVMVYPLPEYSRIPWLPWHPGTVHGRQGYGIPFARVLRIPWLPWHPGTVRGRQSDDIPFARVSMDTMVTKTSRERTWYAAGLNTPCQSIRGFHGYPDIQGSYIVGRVMVYSLPEYLQIPWLPRHPGIVHGRQRDRIPLVRVSADTKVTLTSMEHTWI